MRRQAPFPSIASGDLTQHITAFFDTSVGPKTHSESYRKIAERLARNSCDFLFISDSMNEVKAAHEAGMQAIVCNRDLHSSPQLPETKMVIIQALTKSYPTNYIVRKGAFERTIRRIKLFAICAPSIIS